jgi:hypothetical protein
MSYPGGLTNHARKRLQQRAIPPFILDYLDSFGCSKRCGGSERMFFDKAARRRLAHHLGGEAALQPIERWLGVYAVVGDDGTVVTVGHRTKRLRLH